MVRLADGFEGCKSQAEFTVEIMMKLRFVLTFPAAVLAACLVSPAQAQRLSPESDFAMWCLAAIDYMDEKGILPEGFSGAREDAVYGWHESVVDREIPDGELPALRKSFVGEVKTQIDDWLVNRDSAALRLNLDDCFIPPDTDG